MPLTYSRRHTMARQRFRFLLIGWVLLMGLLPAFAADGAAAGSTTSNFPRPPGEYQTPEDASLLDVLKARVQAEPFNLIATCIFFLAIAHTFMAPMFLRLAHRFEHEHRERLKSVGKEPRREAGAEVSFKAEAFHFLGEIEAIFGIWVVPLIVAITMQKGWTTARDYIGHGLNFTEPLFVVVIMTIAASRPILKFSEGLMSLGAMLGGRTPGAWWLSILSLGPLLGSFITEPAAMTISALLLAEKLYALNPSRRLAYGTLGLLFVNVSIGGTLTHFAAPPVLMVAGKWEWNTAFMIATFGWKAVISILIANTLYFFAFRSEFRELASRAANAARTAATETAPAWITVIHLLFLAWTVFNNHYPALFIGGFLFYLAFMKATEHHQGELRLRPALLVGFFLAGLVVHGGLQGWWIEPVLTQLGEVPLFLGALALTAFNDNAAITYLASLVPGFAAELKYAVVAGAVVGGGLTVIANAPNPAGQSILSRFFPDGVSPLGLVLGAATPTAVAAGIFLLFR